MVRCSACAPREGAARGQCCRTKRHVGTPVDNSPHLQEEVLVQDPCHPLFGRRFRVVARSAAGMPSRAQNILVFYRPGVQLRLPADAVNLPKTGQVPPTKLNGLIDRRIGLDCWYPATRCWVRGSSTL